MKILVIGGGGREHALVWKLAQSPRATQMWCAPGNAGIAGETVAANGSAVECVGIGAEDLPALLEFAREQQVDLTVVGPDNRWRWASSTSFRPPDSALGADAAGRAV